jgi:hypothetical protein
MLEASSEFKYLGLMIHSTRYFKDCAAQLARSAAKAKHGLFQRFEYLGIQCLDTKLRLFNAIIMPIANYACQVWGIDHLKCDSENLIFNNPTQKLIFGFLREVTGCRRGVSRWALLQEFDLMPIQVQWAQLCARYWNKATRQGAPELPCMQNYVL